MSFHERSCPASALGRPPVSARRVVDADYESILMGAVSPEEFVVHRRPERRDAAGRRASRTPQRRLRRTRLRRHRPATEAASGQLLTFRAAGHEYGISILHVREIVECGALTPVPGRSVMDPRGDNLRGTVVPAIDLAAKLGHAGDRGTRRTCLLIIEVTLGEEQTVLAVMVDSVSRVVDLSPDELQEVPSFGPKLDVGFLVGMARIEERLDSPARPRTRIVESAEVLCGKRAAQRHRRTPGRVPRRGSVQ